MRLSFTFAGVKRVTSISLIFILSMQCIYQLGVITYFKLNQEYISQYLCINKEKPTSRCHGQCFLDKLDIAEDKGSDGSTLPVSNQKVDAPVFLISETYAAEETLQRTEESNSPYLLLITSAHHAAPFRPPALLS